jgi:hypothetical protein
MLCTHHWWKTKEYAKSTAMDSTEKLVSDQQPEVTDKYSAPVIHMAGVFSNLLILEQNDRFFLHFLIVQVRWASGLD